MEVAPNEATSVEATLPEQEKLVHLTNNEAMSGDDQTKTDIDKAAEQVLNDWSERLQDSAVFTEPDEENAGELSNSLAAGAFEEVIMGYDEDHDHESEEEIVEEEIVDESFSEEVLDDHDLMDDNDLQEIMEETAEMMQPPAGTPANQAEEPHPEEAVELTLQDSQPSIDSTPNYHDSSEPLLPPAPAGRDPSLYNTHENEPSHHSEKQVMAQDMAQGVHQAHNDPGNGPNNGSQEVEYVDETVYEEEKQETSEPEIDTTAPKPVDTDTDPYIQQFQKLQDHQDLEAQAAKKKKSGKPEAAKQRRQEREEEGSPTLLYVLICIVCLVVIAAAVALPLLLLNKDDDAVESPEVTDVPTAAPVRIVFLS